jgi:flagellar protein FliO/FliZ
MKKNSSSRKLVLKQGRGEGYLHLWDLGFPSDALDPGIRPGPGVWIFPLSKEARFSRETGLEMIRLLESRVLSGNKHLHLVEVGDHIVLIGTSESSIQLLLELKDRETIDSIRLKVSELPSERKTKGFFDLVQQYFHRKEAGEQAGGVDASGEESLEFIRRQRERLNKLH